MSAKLTWFKFDPAKWFMGRISRQQPHVQADFIRLCCVYWSKDCNMSIEDAETEIPESIEQLLKTKIIKVVEASIFIDYLDEQIEEIEGKSKIRSEAATKRWLIAKQKADAKAMQNNTVAMQNNTVALQAYKSVMQTDADKIREEKKRKEKNNVDAMQNEPKPKEVFTPDNSFEKIHLGITEHHQPSGTNIADYVPAYEAWRDRSLVDTLFQSTYTMKFNTTVPEIKRLLNDFHLHIIATGKFHSTMSGWKRHFVSWLEKKKDAGEMKLIFKPNLSNGE